jgi:hypothetical protein
LRKANNDLDGIWFQEEVQGRLDIGEREGFRYQRSHLNVPRAEQLDRFREVRVMVTIEANQHVELDLYLLSC